MMPHPILLSYKPICFIINMNSLTVITEELEEELPDDCPEIVHRLMQELKQALQKIEFYEDQLQKNEANDSRIKELMSLCQSKNTEIYALERKVKDLTAKSEEKDKQIISMLSMATEFKQLVQNQDKSIQTDVASFTEIEKKLVASEEKNTKMKEMLISQIEEIQRLKNLENESRDSYNHSTKKKPEPKVKPGGYFPLFLRKPREGYIGNISQS